MIVFHECNNIRIWLLIKTSKYIHDNKICKKILKDWGSQNLHSCTMLIGIRYIMLKDKGDFLVVLEELS